LAGRQAGVASLVVGIDGPREAIERQTGDIRRIAMEGNAVGLDVLDASEEMTRMVRDLPGTTHAPLVMRAGMPVTSIGRFWNAVMNLEAEDQAKVSLMARAGLGVVYVMIDASEPTLGAVAATIQQLAGQLDGYAVAERIPPAAKATLDIWGAGRDDWPLMQGLKSKFDPKGVMSPGRFIGRL